MTSLSIILRSEATRKKTLWRQRFRRMARRYEREVENKAYQICNYLKAKVGEDWFLSPDSSVIKEVIIQVLTHFDDGTGMEIKLIHHYCQIICCTGVLEQMVQDGELQKKKIKGLYAYWHTNEWS